MNDLDDNTGAGYSIGVVTRRTGLSPDVLRVWERRYAVVTPTRSTGGQRLYSASDIEKLRLLRRLVEGGHRIASVARLDLDALTALSREVEVPAPAPTTEASATNELLDAMMAAVTRLDAATLEGSLRRSALAYGAETWVDAVVGPFLEQVGDRWHAGAITPAHEHLASATVREVLGWVVKSFGSQGEAAAILIATPAGELHELGAMMAAVVAAGAGWRVHYLGPNVPADDLIAAARQLSVAAVGLSVVHPDHVARALDEVAAVRRGLSASIPVIVGGAGATEAAAGFTRVGATLAADARSLRAELGAITPT